MKRITLLERLGGIRSENPEGMQQLKEYLEQCFDPHIPSHLINIENLYTTAPSALDVNPEDRSDYTRIIREISEHLRRIGYRTLQSILTHQEHILIGSSDAVPSNLYTPFGLISGEYTLAEIRKARQLQRVYPIYIDGFYRLLVSGTVPGFPECSCVVTLEPLNDKGMTARDPRPVDKHLKPLPARVWKKTENFPFRRG